jgi:hypothetical protein
LAVTDEALRRKRPAPSHSGMRTMTRIAFVALAVGAMMLSAIRPMAQETADMAQLTCADIESEEDTTFYIAWVDGFLRGKTGESSVAVDWFEKLAEHVATACETDSERTLISVVEALPRQ